MKTYGKYEKIPDSTKAKKSVPQRFLLQTYLISLISMVLCVTMFFGTTYAWLTSEVINVGNEIYTGILDVELEKKLAEGSWVSLSEKENGVNRTNLFDKDICWEPGFTTLATVRVINKGNLAFRYTLNFCDGKVTDRAEKMLQDESWWEVAEQFDVWVYDHREHGNTAPEATSYAEITRTDSGWVSAGSLLDLLLGKPVLKGEMVTVRGTGQDVTNINKGIVDGVATEATYTIALHMKEDADTTVMGHKISLSVKLIAHQVGKE